MGTLHLGQPRTVVERPDVLLWDFGDTLVDERWMRRVPEGFPMWEKAWSAVMADMADDWNVGLITAADVFGALANRTGMTRQAVEAHARLCCQQLDVNATAWRVASERRMPQAIVTVNPDLFADYIVDSYGLGAIFDEIVMSFAEGTADKSALCSLALDRLGFRGDRSRALLIDNRRDLVEAWTATGGAGYWFQGDEAFEHDLPAILGHP
jgi:hypothetical protein